jgi:hypothetical protein
MIFPFVSRRKYENLALYCSKLQGEIERQKDKADFNEQLFQVYSKLYKDLQFKTLNPKDEKGRFCGVQVVQ